MLLCKRAGELLRLQARCQPIARQGLVPATNRLHLEPEEGEEAWWR